jgi:hypothetical protein
MTNNIQTSISTIIQQNLPEAVGQELKTELTRLYEIEKNFDVGSIQLKDVKESLDKKRKECDELQSKCKELTEQNFTLESQAEAVQLAQIKINELVLQAKLDAASTSNLNLLNLVQAIFKSPTGKRMVSESSTGYQSPTGQWVNPPVKTVTELITEEPSI